MRTLLRYIRSWFRSRESSIDPHEVLIDTTNLPAFDEQRFEGRMERPISKPALVAVGFAFVAAALLFTGRLWTLQIQNGSVYAAQSEENRLHKVVLFADRGVIYDRAGTELAWNVPNEEDSFALRSYRTPGFAHLLGYIGYPLKDRSGILFRDVYVGQDGAEQQFNAQLSGENGVKLIETSALGEVLSESVVRPPEHGSDLKLSIDADVQAKMHELIAQVATDVPFEGGAGVIMDVYTGEVLALTNYPEYDPEVLSEGSDRRAIASYVRNARKPFLNRVASGLYTPGSIIKPFIAVAALEEGIIDPSKKIVSAGSIRVPNPYVPNTFSVFNDWKAHGAVDLRQALAVSSNVYFYYIGGGFADQAGLGIDTIERYMRSFGFGESTGAPLVSEGAGVIPSPSWKEAVFDGEPWRVGDTYNTSIGQYGFQVTPLQVVRGVAAIANGGTLLTPTFRAGEAGKTEFLPLKPEHLQIVREGMRMAVTEGTARGLDTESVAIAAKTGTAEIGVSKDFVNSWATGFFPYDDPRYAFAVVFERGPRENLLGGVFVMRQLIDWMYEYEPELLSRGSDASGR